ncbi:DMT family transporter [Rhodobacteraceae bacterium M382]|nr:DMT family transporter [Rhodobacteraceae bacterium M382]
MQALILGLAAALAWGVHDLCVRLVAPRTSIPSAILTVFLTGAILVSIAAFFHGELSLPSGLALSLSCLSGAVFAGGSYGIYRAFAIGPVKLVAPIIGSFPILSVALASLQGKTSTLDQWLAVFVVVGGVGCVAILSKDEEEGTASTAAILWSILAATCFSASFALGHAATQAGSEMPVLVATRLAGVATIAIAVLAHRSAFLPTLRTLPVLIAMGLLDALALGLVLMSGNLPNPEFSSVSSSLFGLITVILAWALLRESMTKAQWVSVAVTFSGIAYLGL